MPRQSIDPPRRSHNVFYGELRQLYHKLAKLSILFEQLIKPVKAINIGLLLSARPSRSLGAVRVPARWSSIPHDSLRIEVAVIPRAVTL